MKVKLPRTLLEPGTIPWPTLMKNHSELAMAIIKAIQDFFRIAEDNDEVPTDEVEAWGEFRFSVAEIISVMESIAEDMGAETARVRFQAINSSKMQHGGFQYVITFSVSSTKYYRMYINYWFDPNRRTTFN